MTGSSLGIIYQVIKLLKKETPRLEKTELENFVLQFLNRRQLFLECVEVHGSPLYVLDLETLKKRADRFKRTFNSFLPNVKIFYALKSNNHPDIISTLVNEGLGLDVSSGLELRLALDSGTDRILFSGPGKSDEELALVACNSEKVTVLMDSFGELERLQRVASTNKVEIRAGVRVTTDENGIWRKFGIPLSDFARFLDLSDKCNNIRLEGIQFHLSWNLNAENHVVFIARLATALRNISPKYRDQIEFIDIGGGFWPQEGEWLQPAATPDGIIRGKLAKNNCTVLEHFKWPAVSIENFAEHIFLALIRQLPEDMKYRVYVEPGRWLCNDAMHILLKVIDRKAPDIMITDGGTNAIGWERFETDYFPVINLTRPSLDENECLIAGSLCTPHDIWGYSYFGEDIKPGDILLVPNQGAYTWSLRQNFIKPVPKVVTMPSIQAINKSENYQPSINKN